MADPVHSALITKLDQSGFLTAADRVMLGELTLRSRAVAARQDLIREGDRPENVLVVLDGFACRYKLMPDGRRHIMALLIPGDFCDLHVAILGHMDHSIATLTACSIADLPRALIDELAEQHPRITRALWWATLADEGILREWLVNMGRRAANRQLAHLFCELHLRLLTVGMAAADSIEMPLRQNELADVLGLTTVHVNRMLQEMRTAGLITLSRRKLRIPDLERLHAYCDFNSNYLHLKPRTNGWTVEAASDP